MSWQGSMFLKSIWPHTKFKEEKLLESLVMLIGEYAMDGILLCRNDYSIELFQVDQLSFWTLDNAHEPERSFVNAVQYRGATPQHRELFGFGVCEPNSSIVTNTVQYKGVLYREIYNFDFVWLERYNTHKHRWIRFCSDLPLVDGCLTHLECYHKILTNNSVPTPQEIVDFDKNWVGSSFTINEKTDTLWIIGGSCLDVNDNIVLTNRVFCYCPTLSLHLVQQKNPFCTPIARATCCFHMGTLCVCGGSFYGTATHMGDLLTASPDVWHELYNTKFPNSSRNYATAVAFGNYIYVFGGTWECGYTSTVIYLDTSDGAWHTLADPKGGYMVVPQVVGAISLEQLNNFT